MGSKPSAPVQTPVPAPAPAPAPAPRPAPPPPSPATLCAVRRVELGQLQQDVQNKQNQIEQCDPQGTQTRRTQAYIAEQNTFIQQKQTELDSVVGTIQKNITVANKLWTSSQPIQQYINELKQEASELEKENTLYEREARAYRRSFLDNSPQSGVSGIAGIRTTDDKVLLAFWITYGFAIISIAFVVLHIYGEKMGSTLNKVQIILACLIFAYALAYYAIVFYA